VRSGRGRSPSEAGVACRGCLLLADISGYTDYLLASPLEYAEDVLSDVMTTVVGRLEPVLRLNKLEGDAAFCYALESEIDSSMLLDTIEECYFAFRARLRGIEHSTSCSCPACAKLPALNLKFIAHHGEFIRRATDSGEELTGQDVIVVHRLLKNSVAETLGLTAYALFTEACVVALGMSPPDLGLVEHRETRADLGETGVFVEDLESRWQEEQGRRRSFVTTGEAAFEVETVMPAPPPVVWDWLTSPGRRMLWQGSRIDEVTAGGRRSTGTTSVCVDGRAQIYEEILDWRPFRYFTERNTLRGSIKLVLTTELEEIEEGTRVRTRARRLQGKDRLVWLAVGPQVQRKLRDGYGQLAQLLAVPEPRFSSETRLPVL